MWSLKGALWKTSGIAAIRPTDQHQEHKSMIDDKGPEEGDFPQYEGQDPYIPPVEPLPCPFCGEQPKVIPRDALEGSCWGEVYCGNHNCKVKVRVRDWVDCNDERGSEQYKRAAILNWNTRV